MGRLKGKKDCAGGLLRGDIGHGHGATVAARLALAAVVGPAGKAAVGRGGEFGIDIEVQQRTPVCAAA